MRPFLSWPAMARPIAMRAWCLATWLPTNRPAIAKGQARPLAVLLAALLCASPAWAATTGSGKPTERSKQKAMAESERAQLARKLSALKNDISHTEAEKEEAADTLAASEAAISNANRALHDLALELQQTEKKLKQLAAEQKRLTEIVTQQQTQLGKLLRQHYVAGKEDRIKLLLSGDNPNRIERDLQYMGYLSQAQAAMLATLRANLAAVEKNQEQTQNTQDELAEIAEEQKQQKLLLEQEKTKRSALLAQVSQKLQAQRKEASNLAHDEERMSNLINRLGKLIEEQAAQERKRQAEQKRLAAERAARQAQEAQARAQAQAQARARNASQHGRKALASSPAMNPPTPPAPVSEDTPKTVQAEAELSNDQLPTQNQDANFAALRGKLHLPLRGNINQKFGSKRAEGPASRGVFIRAAEGSEVKAVANGRVMFADWLRGFGNLLIIDHGGQYLTVYGNNQSLLKRAGDVIKGGDTIAYAGNSGGNEESGLYFEIRHQGRAVDPLGWVTLK